MVPVMRTNAGSGAPPRALRGGSVRRLFGLYAVVSLVPVVLLTAVLLVVVRREGDARGLAEARTKAALLGRTVVAPILPGADLSAGVSPEIRAALNRSVHLAVQNGDVLRLRIRDLSGRVVFADDNSTGEADDDEALDAARGQTVSKLTHLNDDSDTEGPSGPRAVEIYEPLAAATSGRRIGVLELYLPYRPIAQEIGAERHSIELALAAGLGLLWIALLGVSASVTRRLRRQVAITAFLATHDPLTELPNRVQFAHLVDAALAGGGEPSCAVAVIDLDRFKQINDVLGPANGDRLLVQLAARLRGQLEPGDALARLGGDEFGVIISRPRDESDAVERLTQLRRVISRPLEVNGVPLVMEASIGVALAPDDGATSEGLLQRADLAMYVAKHQHLGVVRYCPEHDSFDASALALVAELRDAIDRDELVLHFQAKGDLRAGGITELEALVRWQHPRHGLLYPDAFVPLAEQTELIDDLTRWVVRTATQALPELDPTGRLSVAVNVSARSIVGAEFADDLLAALAGTGTDPGRVVVEITETALMVDPAAAARTLARLHASGVRISIDDFGAGQTSLGYLATLPISELKIDKTFVMPMLAEPRKAAIVRSVIELGHSLGFTVTAEGVETRAILRRLRREGCDIVQGYLLARPVPKERLAEAMAGALQVLDALETGAHAAPV
jgi:diguanylate cyclase